MSKQENKSIGIRVILKIGDVEHSLTLEEIKTLSLALDTIIHKEQPSNIPWVPLIPQPLTPHPYRPWWDVVYCGDNPTISLTSGGVSK